MTKFSEISRVLRTKAEARRNYNRLSASYDWIAGASERKFREQGIEALQLKAGESFLEIGVGTGHSLRQAASFLGENASLYGLDLSEEMLKKARTRFSALREKRSHSSSLHLCCGDALTLPFHSRKFDVLFMSFTLELFDTPEIPAVLQECSRVLKPSGRMGVVSLVKREKENWSLRCYEWAHQRWPIFVDCRPIWAQALLKNEGFSLLSTQAFSLWGLPVEVLVAVAPCEAFPKDDEIRPTSHEQAE
jgi:ubiquinone/menaquinone biosynthesis C-methylase UbiE